MIPYKCLNCGMTETIFGEVVECFDEMDGNNIDESPCFSCKNVGAL